MELPLWFSRFESERDAAIVKQHFKKILWANSHPQTALPS
jgi:hypothetical protein